MKTHPTSECHEPPHVNGGPKEFWNRRPVETHNSLITGRHTLKSGKIPLIWRLRKAAADDENQESRKFHKDTGSVQRPDPSIQAFWVF
jgi:hypothetical protein